ncbi:MAG TPA: hypothetical protein VFO62_10415 [Candidatus Binatia bacterium]|nr:hypothetical protein [Candidatus Binatia bacterium]
MSADEDGDVVRVCAEGEIMSRILIAVFAMMACGACAVESESAEHAELLVANDASAVPLANGVHHVSIPAAGATAKPEEAWFDRMRWQIPSAGAVYFPVAVEEGCTITGWLVNMYRASWQQPMAASLIKMDPGEVTTGIVSQVQAGPDDIGNRPLASPPLNYTVPDKINLYLELWSDSIWGAAHVYSADVWYTCPQ